MRHHKIWSRLAVIALIICYALLMVVFYWLLYPYKTIEHFPDRYRLAKTELKQGEWTSYSFDYCKYTDVKPTISKEFIDGIIFEAPATSADLKKGCGKATIPMQIPHTLPPGNYNLKIQAAFQMNPIRVVTETNITQEFTVLPK